MRTSHSFLRLFLALSSLIACGAIVFGQTDSVVQVSDQKAGSLLVYPYYASGASAIGSGDTRITISNVGPTPFFTAAPGVGVVGAAPLAQTVAVHIFLLEGVSCAQADIFLCLTPNASVSFRASEYDPFTARGAIYAVAVDAAGYPIAYNGLIGNAFVNYTDAAGRQYIGNYGAEAFFALGTGVAAVGLNGLPVINFYPDGVIGISSILLLNNGPRRGIIGYDAAPSRFAVEIQSPLNAIDQTIATVGLTGDVLAGTVTGAAQIGVGQIINGNERPFGSFTSFTGGCTSISILTASFPRVPLGLNGLIPSGQIGTIQFSVTAAVGLLMTPQRVGQTANAWSGIRTLHKTAVNEAATLTLPVFIPVC